MRRFFALLLLCMVAAATPAAANPEPAAPALNLALGVPCALASDGAERPRELIAQRARFDCTDNAPAIYGPVTWALFDGLSITVTPDTPLQFRHSPHPFQSQRAYARLADGRVIDLGKSATGSMMALSSEVISYDLPAKGSPITALLIREVGMQHQRGIATEARVITADAAAQEDGQLVLYYAAMAGVVFALLFVNTALYATLRYRFILANCAATAVICLMSLSWAGQLLPFTPDLELIDQISIMQFGIACHLACSVMFMLNFIERDRLHPLALWIAGVPVALGTGAAAMRLVDVQFQWETIDLIFYAGLTIGSLAKLYFGVDAVRRGSRAAWIFLAVAIPPTLCALVRAIWGQELFGQGSMFLVISPTMFIVMSALLDSLAVSWRIAVLRDERNHAYELAETDPMTGLFNRRAFAARALVGHEPKQLVLIDIDRFKLVNDTHGHQVGDEVIIHLGHLLRLATPPDAVVGRMGGEEFAVLTRAVNASGLAEAIRCRVADSPFPHGISISVSIGSTLAIIGDEQQWADAYGAADSALYHAKRSGRNRVHEAVAIAVAA